MEIDLIHSDRYTFAQTLTQHLTCELLTLCLHGVDYFTLFAPGSENGSPLAELGGGGPFLALLPRGMTIKFRMNEKRENWAALLRIPELRWLEAEKCHLYRRIPLAPFRFVSVEEAKTLQQDFSAMTETLHSGLPASQLRARLLCGTLIAGLIGDNSGTAPEISRDALALKQAIDGDRRFEQTLLELNLRMGKCSMGHARRVFAAAYGLSPEEYRARLRMNRIFELLSHSTLTLKEIADEVGMKHVTHLYAFLKRRQQLTPKALLRQFRD